MKIKFLNSNRQPQNFDTKLITIGREDDNHLQLLSDGISRHHGKIYCDSGNNWYIEDLGSTNGIKLNGKKINKPTLLAENDILDFHQEKIQLCEFNEYQTVLEFNASDIAKISAADVIEPNSDSISIDPVIIAPASPLESPAPQQENKENELEKLAEFIHQNTNNLFNTNKKQSKDNEDKKDPQPAKKSKFSNKLFYVVLVCAIVVVGAFLIKILEDKNAPLSTQKNATVTKDYPLYLTYIKENLTPGNVFRFKLVIENNEASFSVDDLRSQLRYGPIVKSISNTELIKLKQTIKDSQFMKLAPVSDGITKSDEREFKELIIHYGLQNNHITLKNRPTPREFLDVEEAINIFAESCNMATFSLSPEELREQALANFRLAEDKFANYETNLSYLKDAIHGYNIVIEYLSGISPEPKIRREAAEKMKRAEELRKRFIKQYSSQYKIMLRKEDLDGAKNALEILLQLYDVNTKEYLNTKRYLIKVDTISKKLNSRK